MIFFNGDYLDVNISSYKDGQVSGTFAGKLTTIPEIDYSKRGEILITEGKLNNVPVY